jgi:hypothetical protein
MDGGLGARQRKFPTGGAAYRRPRNARTLLALIALPWTLPSVVFTTNEIACVDEKAPTTKSVITSARTVRTRIGIQIISVRYSEGCSHSRAAQQGIEWLAVAAIAKTSLAGVMT